MRDYFHFITNKYDHYYVKGSNKQEAAVPSAITYRTWTHPAMCQVFSTALPDVPFSKAFALLLLLPHRQPFWLARLKEGHVLVNLSGMTQNRPVIGPLSAARPLEL